MAGTNSRKQHKIFPRHRLILVASTAILGVTVLLAGPSGYVPTWVSSARAADSTVTHPASFADLVAKVKPAVISVQVKIDESAKMTGMSHNGNDGVRSLPARQWKNSFSSSASKTLRTA